MAGKDSIECNGVLQWCHIIGRSNYRLRWEEQNSLCMCAAHHVYYTFNTWVWQEIIREQFPENYDFIEAHRLEQFDKDYSSLIERSGDTMEPVAKLLETKLDTNNGHRLAEQLVEIEAWGYRISQAHRDAEHKLSEMKGKLYDPSLSSEDKRRMDLEYKVRNEARDAAKLLDAQDLVKRRISLGQTLLKNLKTELDSGVRL